MTGPREWRHAESCVRCGRTECRVCPGLPCTCGLAQPVRFSGGPWDGQFRSLPPNCPSWRVPIPPVLDPNPQFAEDYTIGEYRHEPFLDAPGERVFVWQETGAL